MIIYYLLAPKHLLILNKRIYFVTGVFTACWNVFIPSALSRNHLMNIWDHFHSVSIFPSNSSSVFSPGLHFWVNQIQMCSVQANLKVQICFHPLLWLAAGNGRSKGRTNSPPSCILGVRIFSFLPAFFTDTGKMASAHDRAVLQAIFNPSTPFGDIPGLNQEEELIDDGERVPPTWCVSTYHVTAFFYVYHFTAYWIYLNASHSWN